MPKKNDEKDLFEIRSDAGLQLLDFLQTHEVVMDVSTTLHPMNYVIQGDYIQTTYQIKNNNWCKTAFLCYKPYEFCKLANGNYITLYDLMKVIIQDYSDEISKDNYLLFSKIVADVDDTTVTPKSAEMNIAPIHKLSQSLPLLELVDSGMQGMKIIEKGKKGNEQDIITLVDITSIENNVKFSKQIKPFDMVVHSAVISLYEAKNNIITPQMIYRHITGGTKKQTRNKQQLEEIEASLDRQMNINISIDCTYELRLYKKEVTKGNISGRMLPAMKMSVLIGGQWLTGYKMQDMPFLYTYANNFNQIARYPTRLLGLLSNKYSDNTARYNIKFYILNRLSSMKRGNKINSILYKTIFENCDLENVASIQKTRHKEFIRAYLTELKNIGFISDYSDEKSRKIIIKI